MTEKTTTPKPESGTDETVSKPLWDFRNLDKFVIFFAAVLTFCGFAVLLKPAMGEAIGKVYIELLMSPPPAPKPVVTPGIVDMQIYATPAKPAAQPEPKKK